MRFDANLDHIDALAEERTLEWRRIGEAGFLTLDEQRAAAGYGPAPQGFAAKGGQPHDGDTLELRYRPDQPRAPAGQSDGGRWVAEGGGGGGGNLGVEWLNDTPPRAARTNPPADATPTRVAMNIDPNVANDAGGLFHLAQNRPGRSSRLFPGPGGPTYGQLSRLEMAQEAAKQAIALVRAREPGWRPRTVLSDPKNTEAEIEILETQRSEALARLAEYGPRNSRGNFPSLSGRRAEINDKDDPVTRHSAFRENESADIFFANGRSVEQKPIIPGRKNPDYLIDGEVFDNYAPTTGNLRNIRGLIERKILENQTRNIILNLRDTSVTAKQFNDYLLLYPIEELNKLWIIDRMGQIHYLRGGN